MCGIVGYIGREHRAMDVLIDGLRRLEYRGYDSAGVAIFDGSQIAVRRALGKLANLGGREALGQERSRGLRNLLLGVAETEVHQLLTGASGGREHARR